MKLQNIQIPDAELLIIEGHGLAIQVDNFTAAVSLAWRYREVAWPHVSDHGTADAGVKNAHVCFTTLILSPLKLNIMGLMMGRHLLSWISAEMIRVIQLCTLIMLLSPLENSVCPYYIILYYIVLYILGY